MKRLLYLLAAGLIVLLPQTSSAQTSAATANITAGRNQLKLQTPAGLAAADSYFAKALTNNATNLEANLLKAATSLLLEQNSAQFQAQLTGFGVNIENNNIYGNLEYVPPLDANGDILPNSGFTTNSTLAYLNSKNALIDAVLVNLAKFGSTSSSFKTFLSAEETALDYTLVDYGDVLMMRALLKGFKAIIALANSYNINAECALLFALGKNGELTPQKLLEVLPDLFKFADSTQRAMAKTLIVSANTDYQAAHTFIKKSRQFNGVPYLFEYNDISEADLYATQINGMVTSLNAGTDRTLTLLPDSSFQGGNVTLNPAAFFSSTKTLREFIASNSSAFSYGYPTRTSWPDPTFGGVLKAGGASILNALEETFNDLRFEQRLLRLRMRPVRSGTIKAWGSNATRQTAVPSVLSGVVQVAAGGAHSLALKSDGTLVGWGGDSSGQASIPKTLVSTLAGSSYNYGGWDGDDGKGEDASFEGPEGIAVDKYGALYVADTMNNKIRKITPQGVVTTLAGSRDNYGGGMGKDGTGTAASFSSPEGIAVDQYETVYVADTMNNKIRKITPSGVVTTLAGGGMGGGAGIGKDGTGTAASFSSPEGIAVDQYGTVYVADTMNGKIRKITPAGVVKTLAGGAMGGDPMGQDGIGSAASFSSPKGIAVDIYGNVFVTDGDASSSKIRKISPAGVVTTLAGGGMEAPGMGQDGAGASASFSQAKGIAVDGSGTLFVADTMNNKIRKITSLTTVNQIAAGGAHSLALLADGTVIGWGKNDFNQSVRDDWRGTISNAVQIAAGENHSLALREDGSVVAWGDNSKMQAPDEWDWNSPMSSLNDIVQIAAGGNHSLALRSNGTLAAWGDNTKGQTSIPTRSAKGLIQIATGGAHSLALTANGTVIAWGDNSSGQCTVPTGLTGVVQIAAGKAHSMAIKSDGTVVAWGNNTAGQKTIPTGISNPIQAAAGGAHSLMLLASGPAGAPEITVQPLPQLFYAKSNATFSVTATGANLTYQWLRNGATVAGATGATYKFAPTTLNVGNYTVRVSNSLGNVTSSPATLSLRPAAGWIWTSSGPSAPIQVGSNATFSVGSVTGPGTIAYQWLKNGVAISGKTSSALVINPVSITDGGIYNLNITTSAGTISTESKTLVVGDSRLVVYSMNATGNSTIGATKQTANFGGYLVRERSTGKSHFFWMDAVKKTYTYELRTDLTEKSTGPFVGSTSVLRGYASSESDEEMVWFSGTDALNDINTSIKTLAPSVMTGQINSFINDNSASIEMLNVALALHTAQTLKARTTDANAAATVTRITNEIKALGYK